MDLSAVWLVTSVLIAVIVAGNAQNVNSSGESEKTPLYILVMVNLPDARPTSITGWKAGLDLLTAGRVAVKQINAEDTILKDYDLRIIATAHEPCGFTDGRDSVANLVYYGTNPSRKVAAVLGLYCSSTTRFLSEIAGTPGFDLMQLSASNSPVFNQLPFPRLWRFLQSADAYADVMLQLMEKYDWTDISLVQDFKSDFYVGIASAFLSKIQNDTSKRLVYHGGVLEDTFVEDTLIELQNNEARIIFLTATESQVIALVCGAYARGMTFPNYVWVVVDYRYTQLEPDAICDDFYDVMYGSLFSYFVLEFESHIRITSANITYQQYSDEYDIELKQVKIDYSDLIERAGYTFSNDGLGDKEYGGVLYDQVWAFAIAVNSALPELKAKNISIEDYGFGQPDVTDILEDYLRKVEFRGASGNISFTGSREVSSRVSVYQTTNGTLEGDFVGFCKNSGNKGFTCDDVDLPVINFDDKIKQVIIKLPVILGVALILVICIIVSVITFVFILVIYYRTQPEVKATSPILSSIMFGGCYLICFAALLHSVQVTFNISELSFKIICNLEVFLAINGYNLIFITLFIKLFRIFRIFSNQRLSHLSWIYNNYSLLAIVLIICLIPDIMLMIMFGYDPLVRQVISVYRSEPRYYDVQHFGYSDKYPSLWISLVSGYLAIFVVFILCLAISTRKIQNENFKDTKKVNVFLFLTVLSFSLPIPCSIVLLGQDNFILGNVLVIIGLITLPCFSQVMLFMPKVLPVLLGLRGTDKWRRSSIAKSLRMNSFLF